MPTTVSPYSISVGQRQPDGRRAVTLHHCGCPVFSVEHREVQWTFLASFNALGEKPIAPQEHDLFRRATVSSASSGIDEGVFAAASGEVATATTAVASPSGGRPPQEYLCVFHREELKDRIGCFVGGQPTVVCSAYAVCDGTSTTFALHSLAPSAIAAGQTGVFVHGSRIGARGLGAGVPRNITFEGSHYRAAADTWWMASPLVVKPVYVKVPHTGEAAAFLRVRDGCEPTCSPRTSPGQALPRSRSTTSMVALFGPSQEAGTARAARVTCNGQPCLNAQVLFEFTPTGRAAGRRGESESFALLRTDLEELGLARTRVAHHIDAMTIEAMPHHVTLPGLSAPSASLTVTISEHPLLAQEAVLFLYDSLQSKVHIISVRGRTGGEHVDDVNGAWCKRGRTNTPCLGMEVLYTLENADFPLLLPCLRSSAPQPVMVVNYPEANTVTLFSPLRLLKSENGRHRIEDGIIATLPLADPLCAAAAGTWNSYSGGPCSRTATSPVWLRLDEEDAMGGVNRDLSSTCSLPSRIVAVAYQDRHTLSLVYGAPKVDQTNDGCRDDSTGATNVATRGGEHSSLPQLRSAVAELPCLQEENGPLLNDVLEVLTAAVGPAPVYRIEEELIRLAWAAEAQRLCGGAGDTLDFTSACIQTLQQSVLSTVCAGSVDLAGESSGPRVSFTRGLSSLVDPLAMTADTIAAISDALSTDQELSQVSSCTTVPLTAEQCALSTVGLHLLCESYKLQEKLWSLLDRLSGLVRSLCVTLGWDAYMQYYVPTSAAAVRGAAAAHSCEKRVDARLPPHVSREKFTFASSVTLPSAAFLGGVSSTGFNRVDSVMQRLAAMSDEHLTATLVGRGLPPSIQATLANALSGANHKEGLSPLDAWPMLRGLPPDHPLEVANRVVRTYAELIPASDPLYTRMKAGAQIGYGFMDSQAVGNSAPAKATAAAAFPWWYRVCQAISPGGSGPDAGFVHQGLSAGAALPLRLALLHGGDIVTSDADDAFTAAVGRLDNVRDPVVRSCLADPGRDVVRLAEERAIGRQYRANLTGDDGVMMRRDFPHVWRDARLDMAQLYFSTSRPLLIPSRAPGGQPADALKTLALRVCALPIGRGMLTMATHTFRVRDSIPIPRLVLDGRTADGVFVANTVKEMQPDAMLWPLFHSGCAAGLRFLPLDSSGATSSGDYGGSGAAGDVTITGSTRPEKENVITRHWVVYQTKKARSPAARAGLLLAAGLLGHLRVLQLTDIYSLLVSPHVPFHAREATTMAVMLGLSCSFRGTNNDLVFRCLSMHIQSLTPSAEEIDVTLDVQTCALVSIGLLCQRTPTNAFLVEMFLGEMSRCPSDEHCTNREGYALGAGYGLGLLLLGLGASHGIAQVENRLFAFLEGGRRDAVLLSGDTRLDTFEERTSNVSGNYLTRALLMRARRSAACAACTRVYEGDYYNASVSGPAAAVALGLMYLKTDDSAIAARLRPPDRLSGLQSISPMLCLLRTLFASLTVWSSVAPTSEYVHRVCVPSVLQTLMSHTKAGAGAANPAAAAAQRLASQQVHYLLMIHGYCIAGAVLAVGLRYAGSMDGAARVLILAELKGFLKGNLGATGIPVPTLQRSTGAYEICLAACCIAVGLVMAGTGDLSIFGLLQRLHARPSTSYGTHMAVSMSAGLLFLGGGRLSLSSTTDAITALLLAVHPVWPKGPEDNVHHLQILRHLYGLAVVPRTLEAVDVVSNQPVNVPVRVVLRAGTSWRHGDGSAMVAGQEEGDGSSGESGNSSGKRRRGTSGGVGSGHWTSVPCGQVWREIWLETPCLYPPPEAIERIEIRSNRHYNRTLRWQDGDIGERGLLVRVLETTRQEDGEGALGLKEECETSPYRGAASLLVRNAVERGLIDWVQQLFSHRGLSVAEATVILDNVRLVCLAQRWSLLLATARDGPPSLALHKKNGDRSEGDGTTIMDNLVSRDVCLAVVRTLEERYRALFVHGPSGTRAGHPLYRMIFENESFASVIASVLRHPSGTPAFPLDFTAMSRSAMPTASSFSSSDAALDAHEVGRWLVESVHLHFGSALAFAELAEALRARRPQVEKRATRTLALLQVNENLGLPFTVLQQVIQCCFDD